MFPACIHFHSTSEGELNSRTTLQMVGQQKVFWQLIFRANSKAEVYLVLFVPQLKYDSMTNANVSSCDLGLSGQETNMRKEGSEGVIYF